MRGKGGVLGVSGIRMVVVSKQLLFSGAILLESDGITVWPT